MWRIYLKEILELTRDRKTLIFTVLLPTIVVPLVTLGIGFVIAEIVQKSKQEVLNYTIIGKSNYPQLVEALKQDKSIRYVESIPKESIAESIKEDKIRFAIEVNDDAQKKLSGYDSLTITLIYNDASPLSHTVFNRVEKHIKSLNKDNLLLRVTKLTQTSLNSEQLESFIEPIRLEKKSTAEKRESLGETLGSIIPYILILIALTGAMYPAIDIGAGEKERGTLETLLLTPVSRFQIVIAKFLVLLTTSVSAVFLSLASISFWFLLLSSQMLHSVIVGSSLEELFSASLFGGFFDLVLIFILLLLTGAIFASLLLSISIYARTFKEAQNYMSPLMMLLIFPIMIVILPGVELDWFWASIPLTNIALAIKELIKGTIDYSMLFVIFGSTTLFAGILLSFCSWWFQREQVLFRS